MLGFFKTDNAPNELCAQIVKLASYAVIVIDAEKNILMANPAAVNMFEYTSDEMTGQPVVTLMSESMRYENKRVLESFLNNNNAERCCLNDKGRVMVCQRKNGEQFHTRTTLMRLDNNGKPAIALIISDITEDKKSEEELLKLASTDPLTGVYNRREFSVLAEREAKRSRRYDRPLAVMRLEISNYAELSDRYGPFAGDKALQRLTSICCNALRNIDIFGRWGGGEFIALLPETSAEKAGIIAGRLKELLENNEIDYEGDVLRMKIDTGVTEFKTSEQSLENPLKRMKETNHNYPA